MNDARFQVGAKALSTITQPNGDLIITGYAAIFEGDDREGENFAPGAFERGIKSFIGGRSPLVFHHRREKVLGRVLSLEQDAKGLKMTARVDGEIATHPELGVLYAQIKKGSIDGLSIGGLFKRGIVNGKRKIVDMDFTEISVTATPVHPGPSFSVVAGKALGNYTSSSASAALLGLRISIVESIMDTLRLIALRA